MTRLLEGVYAIGFSYPVVPEGKARIRVQLSAVHEPSQISEAIESFVRVRFKHRTRSLSYCLLYPQIGKKLGIVQEDSIPSRVTFTEKC